MNFSLVVCLFCAISLSAVVGERFGYSAAEQRLWRRKNKVLDALILDSSLIFMHFFAALLGAKSITDCNSFPSIDPHEYSRRRVRVLSQPPARLNKNSQQWPLAIADHTEARELHSISFCFRRKASSGIRIRGTTFPLGRQK